MKQPVRLLWFLALTAICGALPLGCAPKSTEPKPLEGTDFDMTENALASSLAKSAFLIDRNASAPPIEIVIDTVDNETDGEISDFDEWKLMSRVVDSSAVHRLEELKNVHFRLSPHDLAKPENSGYEMVVVFESAARAGTAKQHEIDRDWAYFQITYKIATVQSRQVVWSGNFGFRRQSGVFLLP